ncbi:MAG: hypothetical protein IKU60_03550 [Clostridia bacterium]|nr:hypothetical protein [Clostridia bacterium]
MSEIKCLRCDKKLEYLMTEDIQMGKHSFIFGDLPHLFAGGLTVSVYRCPICGKLEFFSNNEAEEKLPQVKCPKCGKEHDFDYPKCPHCNYVK